MMGLCKSLEWPYDAAKSTKGKKLWSCDGPDCTSKRVPWGKSWQWFGSIKDFEDDPFSVFAFCCENCAAAFRAANKKPTPINA